jgi:hypothetical protein
MTLHGKFVGRLNGGGVIGISLATIDAQIRLISLMTRRQMWGYGPSGGAA